ncbi:MAG TPA: 1-(5-phosphoribosyl)-5-[(5-phosphoribosylamino)methylideneamino] imidazole-4-carboxamide isomerase, partial [Thermomicrobiales bacterium]|nr:1-(5-phosphoribosyl)-5-[(5-phosphoribosylamino)methylideneamino] imidazole-4-carboxamide isomerase [Thermomicrobiales bacterium]
MIIYPAIDLRAGKAVRLVEGDFNRETVFDADPVEAARRWQDAGAEWIHLVDLDGARDGVPANAEVIGRIRAAVTTRLQLGGGMRDLANLTGAHDAGIDRMVIGSAAVSYPELVPTAVAAFGDAIAVGIDARNGQVATQGWIEQTTISALDLARTVAAQGVRHIIFTDIARDGRLQGPNLEALRELIAATPLRIIASGGVSTLDDVAAIRAV